MQSVQQVLFPDLDAQQPGWVYYAAGPDGSLKIGYTSRTAAKRLRELRSFLIYKHPGSPLDERRALRQWRKYRVGTSEWHRPESELLVWLMAKVVGSGESSGAKVLGWVIHERLRKQEAA